MMKPSRAEMLASGGIYPVVVPLGWMLIGANGEHVPIPEVQGEPFHRIMAKGALLATEPGSSSQPQVVIVRQVRDSGPITIQRLDGYVDDVVAVLSKDHREPRVREKSILQTSELSSEPLGKAVIHRMARDDGRDEMHYLVRDRAQKAWQLVHLIRRAEVERWRRLLATIDAPAGR